MEYVRWIFPFFGLFIHFFFSQRYAKRVSIAKRVFKEASDAFRNDPSLDFKSFGFPLGRTSVSIDRREEEDGECHLKAVDVFGYISFTRSNLEDFKKEIRSLEWREMYSSIAVIFFFLLFFLSFFDLFTGSAG